MTELACWSARITATVIGLVIIQSLYSSWKEEEMVAKRLRELNMSAMSIPRDPSQYYQNNAFESSMDDINTGIKR